MDLNFAADEEPDPGYCDYYPSRVANSWGFHPWREDESYPDREGARRVVDAVLAGLSEDVRQTDES
jgi:hypothetical protein